MDKFNYQNGQLYCEDVNINILAEKVGTPFYVYSQGTIETHYKNFSEAFAPLNPLICYSIKNCSNLNILKLLVDMGSGIDVVSGGELFRALEAGVDPSKVVFAGVGKSDEEIKMALNNGIGWINIESEAELRNIARLSLELKKKINVTIRVNPNVYDPKTHQKTATGIADSKFGIDMLQAKRLYLEFLNHDFVKLTGVHIHIGSPIYSADPYVKAITKILSFVEELKSEGIAIKMIDIGGGYLAHYDGTEGVKSWTEYSDHIIPLLKDFADNGGLVVLEPGRSLMANAGALICKVLYRKQGIQKKFIIVNTGMSHIIRPALYDAFHFIWPTKVKPEECLVERNITAPIMDKLEKYDIVGPICESSDVLAKNRPLPHVDKNDLLAVFTAGSYCMSMASQYNAIPRPSEILIDGSKITVIRKGEVYEDLVALERCTEEITL